MGPVWPDNEGRYPRPGGGVPPVGGDRAGERRDWVADEVIDAEDFLANLLAEEMIQDPDVRAGRILVTVQNGVVILEGHVDSAGTRSAAARRAWATSGVFDVCNMLVVGRPGPA